MNSFMKQTQLIINFRLSWRISNKAGLYYNATIMNASTYIFNVFQPIRQVVERVNICDVIHQDYSLSTSVICCGQCTESLLASSIPKAGKSITLDYQIKFTHKSYKYWQGIIKCIIIHVLIRLSQYYRTSVFKYCNSEQLLLEIYMEMAFALYLGVKFQATNPFL